MARPSIRVWFCLAVGIIAAAIADPIVEFASNLGVWGDRGWTDRSNLDVVPALLAGLAALVLYVVLKAYAAYGAGSAHARAALRDSDYALARELPRLLFPAFAVQLAALYVMETAEQYAVWGHHLGPAVWLGGPVVVSLIVHAVACVVTAFIVSRAIHALATTALRVIRLMRALATLTAQTTPPRQRRFAPVVSFQVAAPVLCRIGERAPPQLPA